MRKAISLALVFSVSAIFAKSAVADGRYIIEQAARQKYETDTVSKTTTPDGYVRDETFLMGNVYESFDKPKAVAYAKTVIESGRDSAGSGVAWNYTWYAPHEIFVEPSGKVAVPKGQPGEFVKFLGKTQSAWSQKLRSGKVYSSGKSEEGDTNDVSDGITTLREGSISSSFVRGSGSNMVSGSSYSRYQTSQQFRVKFLDGEDRSVCLVAKAIVVDVNHGAIQLAGAPKGKKFGAVIVRFPAKFLRDGDQFDVSGQELLGRVKAQSGQIEWLTEFEEASDCVWKPDV